MRSAKDCLKYIMSLPCWRKLAFAQVAILILIGLSFWWLFVMANKVGAHSTIVGLEYRVFLENADYEPVNNPQITITEGTQHEDALFKVFAEAEDHLREQLNVWLTIIGFFGIVFGLLIPLINYLLQRQTLADERERMTKDLERRFKETIRKVDEHVKEVRKKAEMAQNTAARLEKDVTAMRAEGDEVPHSVKFESGAAEVAPDVAKEAVPDVAKEVSK